MIRLFLLLLLLCLAWPALAADPVPVAAAADLRLALPPLVRGHEAQTGTRFSLSFGSSGQMVQQALNGAPFQLLLLADASHADRLAASVPGRSAGLTRWAGWRWWQRAPAASPIWPA